MKTVMVRYKVKPEAAAENQRLITQVFAQLARDKPAGLRYQSTVATEMEAIGAFDALSP